MFHALAPDEARDVSGVMNAHEGACGENVRVSFWLAEMGPGIQKAALETMMQPLSDRSYYSAQEWQTTFGADPRTVRAVRTFAKTHGLELVPCAENSRLITMSVPPAKVRDLFGVDLNAQGASRELSVPYPGPNPGPTGKMALPAEDFPAASVPANILAVFGLENAGHGRRFPGTWAHPPPPIRAIPVEGGCSEAPREGASMRAGARSAAAYPPAAYGFPASCRGGAGAETGPVLTGKGQKVGVIGFGGSVAADFFTGIAPPGQITIAEAQPISRSDDKFRPETQMDVEIVFQCAPDAHVTVFAFDETVNGWIEGLHGILQSDAPPSVLSISWGWPEPAGNSQTGFWTADAINAVEDLLAGLAIRGVSAVVSSGDAGVEVQYPATSAFVLSCGGTQNAGVPAAEAVWASRLGASGGGISSIIPMPDWQAKAGIECRGVDVPTGAHMRAFPDVAASAIHVSGMQGTSAAAPLWAGLLALANECFQKQPNKANQSSRTSQTIRTVGNINALLYDRSTKLCEAFNDIQQGNNSTSGNPPYYRATEGWDACTGWGSPQVMEFIQALAKAGSQAPDSQTASDAQAPGR